MEKIIITTEDGKSELTSNNEQEVTEVTVEIIYSADSDCEYEILKYKKKINENENNLLNICKFCKKKFKIHTNLIQHLKNHKDLSQECLEYAINNVNNSYETYLDDSILKKALIQSKIEDKKVEYERKYKCKFCTKIFNAKHHLQEHVISFHEISDLKKKKKFKKCNICSKIFPTIIKYRKHMLTHQCLTCTLCNKICKSNWGLATHMKLHAEKPFSCDYCSKHFHKMNELDAHKKRHIFEKPMECTLCNKFFHTRYEYKQHIKIHKNLQIFTCAICSGEFSSAATITRHFQEVHGDIKTKDVVIGDKM